MKRWIVLLLLAATPVSAAPWWQAPPEVTRAVQARVAQALVPFRDRPYQECFQFRDRQGVLWLTLRRVGEDVKEFNRDGALVGHSWRQGRLIRVEWLDEKGAWHRG